MTGPNLPDPLYYLRNFRQAIDWVVERNDDLLSAAERDFVVQLNALPANAQALLVRLLMRQGTLFRRSKIRYAEIAPLDAALASLAEIGWLDPRPALSFHELFRLATRVELAQRFIECKRLTKQEAYEALADRHADTHCFEQWLETAEPVYRVTIAPIALQFRLLHFGNFYQQWHEYTLAHLQIFQYEPVPLGRDSRPFETRNDIEFFYAMYRCYELFGEGAELEEVYAQLPDLTTAPAWLRRSWDRLRYHIGQAAEREERLELALEVYRDNLEPKAQVRGIRVLERLERYEEAAEAARALLSESRSERVLQQVTRIVARLERRLVGTSTPRKLARTWGEMSLRLPRDPEQRVESIVQSYLSSEHTPVFYVENSLICSLFGLLCWDAIFHPLRGAFFHPFQAAPGDLGCHDFVQRRQDRFQACLDRLHSAEYRTWITRMFHEKNGICAPFVHWQALDESLLQLALACIHPEHLKLYFRRLLEDLSENASGLPDLVQFFLPSRTYKFIEVKGPGDRLQDHQRRWMHYCGEHGLPVEVCQVAWA